MKYPEVQEKMAKAIQEIAGSRKISLEHRSKLNYVNAAIEEMTRVNPGKITVHTTVYQIMSSDSFWQ